MHPFLAIPLLSCIASTVLASAIVARDPEARANWLAAFAVGAAGLWALFDLMALMAPDELGATLFFRMAGAACLAIGPLCLELLTELRSVLREPLRVWLRAAYGSALALAVVYVVTPWFMPGAVPVAWGWSHEFGPAFPLAYLHVAGCTLVAAALLLRSSGGRADRVPRARVNRFIRAPLLGVGIGTVLGVGTATDVILPALDFHTPNLGPASIIALGALIWLRAYRQGRITLTSSTFAREILDTLPDGVALIQADGRVRAANQSLGRLVGRPRSELLGCHVESLLTEVPEDFSDGLRERETRLRVDGGAVIPVSLSTSTLSDRGGHPLGLVMAVRDQRQVVALRRQLVAAGRVAAVGELAAGIAHEVNNPIAFIQANLNLLQRHLEAVTEKLSAWLPVPVSAHLSGPKQRIRSCFEGTERVVSIVREVRGFAHAGLDRHGPADLNELLDSALRLALPQIRHRAIVQRAYGELPLVPCAGQDLKLVFLSLILNAAAAAGDAGTIRLATRAASDHVRVSIRDDGHGIEPEQLERFFEPIATTRAVDEGRGLGLAISYQVVREHGGEIRVESEPGAGTCVTVQIPLSSQASEDEPVQP
ncbi:MAG: ATP-binding protein [Proteobacteria bacterium]|nr:ATP-binding protein [Pseudomonadota bacterium]